MGMKKKNETTLKILYNSHLHKVELDANLLRYYIWIAVSQLCRKTADLQTVYNS